MEQIPMAELIQEQINHLSEDSTIKVEYLSIVNGKTLEPVDTYQKEMPLTALIAAKVGEVRLIDNIILQ